MPHWSCSSVLCYNNHLSKDGDGKKLKKYKLPTDPETQAAYIKIFKTTESFDWKSGFICSAHWSSGVRTTSKDLPDVLIPPGHYEILEEKYNRACAKVKAASKPTASQKSRLKKAKAKLEAARAVIKKKDPTPRPAPKVRGNPSSSCHDEVAPPTTPGTPTPVIPEEASLTSEIIRLKELLAEKDARIKQLEEKVQQKSRTIDCMKIEALEKTTFSFEKISEDPEKLSYLSGLSLEQFNLLMDCVRPYIQGCLRYETEQRPATEKTFSYETQYLIVMMICRHGLDFKFVGYMANVSNVTIGRIFNGWVVFLSTLYNQLNLRPDQKFLQAKMPEIFMKTGHGTTDLVIDATEFRFNKASNLDLSGLMFSHYKNTTTGKALVGIAPHGMGIIFSEVYPGSISDTEITEKTDVLSYVSEDHEIMSDRGFSIQDLCAIKGVSLNRPKQKDSNSGKFQHGEIHKNFDITSTRIHVERFIGRVRNWRILNNIWPMNRTDLLSSTWQMICHTVNLVFPPIGPNEMDYE